MISHRRAAPPTRRSFAPSCCGAFAKSRGPLRSPRRRGVAPAAAIVSTSRKAPVRWAGQSSGLRARPSPITAKVRPEKRQAPCADRLTGLFVFLEASMHTIGTPGLWAAFVAVVVVALAIDFLVLRSNGAHRVAFREALLWSVAWISLALLFDLGLWWWLDAHAGPRGRGRDRARVPDRLRRREIARGRQHLRVPDGVQLFLGAGRAAPARADARRARRDRAARDHDLHRRGARRALPLDPVSLRPLPRVHRHQDAAVGEPGARSRSESDPALHAEAPAADEAASAAARSASSTAAGGSSRRSSS